MCIIARRQKREKPLPGAAVYSYRNVSFGGEEVGKEVGEIGR